jgi:hypothetical protein
MTMWRMRIAYWVPKATDTLSEYVMLILFLLQQWLRERVSMLRCTSIEHIIRRYFSVYITICLNYFPDFLKYSLILHAYYF